MLEFFEDFSFQTLLESILQFLPGSPFRWFISALGEIPYLKNINWFVPISEIINVTQVWLGGILLYYIYMPILKVIKAING